MGPNVWSANVSIHISLVFLKLNKKNLAVVNKKRLNNHSLLLIIYLS